MAVFQFIECVAAAVLLAWESALALCPMCRTALSTSPEGQRFAAGFNEGILFLLGVPFAVVAVIAFFIVKAHRTASVPPPSSEKTLPLREQTEQTKAA